MDLELLAEAEAGISEIATESQAIKLAAEFLGGVLGMHPNPRLADGGYGLSRVEHLAKDIGSGAESHIIARAAFLGAALAVHFSAFQRWSLMLFDLALHLAPFASTEWVADRAEDDDVLLALNLAPEAATMYREGKLLQMIDMAALIVQPAASSPATPNVRN